MSEAVFSEEQYKRFEKALIKNEFSKVFALMEKIPDLQDAIVHLRSRLTVSPLLISIFRIYVKL